MLSPEVTSPSVTMSLTPITLFYTQCNVQVITTGLDTRNLHNFIDQGHLNKPNPVL